MESVVPLVYAGLMLLSTVCSVCGNVALLLVLLLNRELHSDVALCLTLSFSACDLALGLSALPFGTHNALFRRGGPGASSPEGHASEGALCQGSGFLYLLLQMASVQSVAWCTVHKFTEICLALRFASLCTAGRTRAALAATWALCLLGAALPLAGVGGRYVYSPARFLCTPSFQPPYRAFNVSVMVLGIMAPILLMCALYGYIVYVARKQVRRGTFMCNDQHCFYVPANDYLRSSVVMVATSVCLLVCWLPYISVCFYETVGGEEVPAPLSALSTWLSLSTAALNPWINALAQTRYRCALRRSLSKLCRVFRPGGGTRPCSPTLNLDSANQSAKTSTASLSPPVLPPQTAGPDPPPAPPLAPPVIKITPASLQASPSSPIRLTLTTTPQLGL